MPDPITPANTAVSEQLSPRFRSAVYVATAMLAAGYAVAEGATDLPWPVMALYAMWNAGAGLLAAANTAAR